MCVLLEKWIETGFGWPRSEMQWDCWRHCMGQSFQVPIHSRSIDVWKKYERNLFPSSANIVEIGGRKSSHRGGTLTLDSRLPTALQECELRCEYASVRECVRVKMTVSDDGAQQWRDMLMRSISSLASSVPTFIRLSGGSIEVVSCLCTNR